MICIMTGQAICSLSGIESFVRPFPAARAAGPIGPFFVFPCFMIFLYRIVPSVPDMEARYR
jgi:hypothetical protein